MQKNSTLIIKNDKANNRLGFAEWLLKKGLTISFKVSDHKKYMEYRGSLSKGGIGPRPVLSVAKKRRAH